MLDITRDLRKIFKDIKKIIIKTKNIREMKQQQ